MPETPVILAHDIFRNCAITASAEDDNHPARHAIDGIPWSWWKGTSATNHYLTVVMENMLDNGEWEIGPDGWELAESGAGDGTYTRNTTTPIQGNGDAKLVVATANDSTDIVMLITTKAYRLKADRTYRMSFAAKSADASKNLRFGFSSGVLVEDDYDFLACGTTAAGDYRDFTPTADGDYHIYFRALTTTTFYIDCVHLAEMPDMDTVVFFKGHTLQNYKYRITKWNTTYEGESSLTWINWTNVLTRDAVYNPNGNTSAGYKTGPRWRIEVTPVFSAGMVYIEYPSIPMIMLGKQWTLPRNFTGSFDPFGVVNKTKLNVGDKGVESIAKQYSQGVFDGTLGNINPTDYVALQKFMDYTDNGMRYFAFVWRPTTDDHDVRLMRLAKSSRNVPYKGGYIREWPFKAVELTGTRKV